MLKDGLYICSVCNEEFVYEQDHDEHYFEHIVKKEIGNYTLYNINSREEGDIVLKEIGSYTNPIINKFKEPGWYYCYTKIERCPRNCCDHETQVLISKNDLISNIEDKIRSLEDKIEYLADEIELLEKE